MQTKQLVTNIPLKRLLCCMTLLMMIHTMQGQHNTNLGFKAGDDVSTGQRNVMVGQRAGESNNGSGNIFIGSDAGKNESGSNKLIISNDSTLSTIYGDLENRRIAIGTEAFPADTAYKLAVEGKIVSREFRATQLSPWPDYVFKDNYELPTLNYLMEYIHENHHLPGIPTAEEVERNGIELGRLNGILLEKIEELTLYIFQQHEDLNNQRRQLEEQANILDKLSIEFKRLNEKVELQSDTNK